MGAIRRFTFGKSAVVYNFDVTSSNWGSITDVASFKAILQSRSGENNNTITNFSLFSGRLRCNITNILYLDISFLNITNVNFITIIGLQTLFLYDNAIVTFNPTIALPASLQTFSLNGNPIVTFDPTIPLPTALFGLYLERTQIVTFNPTIPLPIGLYALHFDNSQIITFNPTIPLPNALAQLRFFQNKMTTTGYANSEPWANAMTVITGRGSINFQDNPASAIGANLKTILEAKGWTVIAN